MLVRPHALLCGVLLTIACRPQDDLAGVETETGTMAPPQRTGTPEPPGPPARADHPLELRALVFTKTAGFRHDSIDAAKAFFSALPASERWAIELTEDASWFIDATLADFDVVAFVNTTGDVLDDAQQAALERFVRGGGGFVGVHAAADTEHDWPWYGELVGGRFVNHPEVPLEATLRRDEEGTDPLHQSIAHLEPEFRFTDEWYNFDRNPRERVTVLLTVDESDFTVPNTPPGPSMGDDHPISWAHAVAGGRAFYTNLGHRSETWSDPRFTTHLLEGMRWAAGGGHYVHATLTRALANPLALAVAPDGSAYVIERTGQVRLWRADTGAVVEALALEVDTGYENGLLGVTLDPDFATNRAVYLYASLPRWSDAPVDGPPGTNAVLRYTARLDGTLDPRTRTVLLEVPSERRCCHEGGSLAFAADGTLLVSTGDNTNPFEAEGASPHDGRPGRETYDARRTAGNPHDLRGKILRIRTDGSAPPGNLFPPGSTEGRPEIFVMGVRNPFRIAADPERFRVFFGDVGPDANSDSVRGPRGYDEINLASEPGDYGWPFCIAENRPYVAVDFATGALGQPFHCANRKPSLLAYDYETVAYEALGNGYADDGAFVGRTAIAGAVLPPATPLPARLHGSLMMTEWTRDILASVIVDELGALRRVERKFTAASFRRPIDVEVGPDGSVYVLEYGTAFWGDNHDARLGRIAIDELANLPPAAEIDASVIVGAAPLEVTFSAARSRVGAGQYLAEYAWDVGVDGTLDGRGATLTHRFERVGRHTIGLVVTSSTGRRSAPVTVDVVVGNAPPEVRILSPQPGTRFRPGTPVLLEGEGYDPEDGPAPCDALTWNIGLIHNTHAHPLQSRQGCRVEFVPTADDHDATQDSLSFSIELVHTDRGGPGGEPPLTARQGIQFEFDPHP